MRELRKYCLLIFIVAFSYCSFSGGEILVINLIIKNHQFFPKTILIPKDHKIKLIIHNQDKTIEEFDSPDLNREKIILGNSLIHVVIAPLKAGKYCFVGEFHPDTANGCLFVK